MKRRASAIGFAVYLDLLERLGHEEESFDADLLLLYGEDSDPIELNRQRLSLIAEGNTVAVGRMVPEKGRYRKILRLVGSEVTEE